MIDGLVYALALVVLLKTIIACQCFDRQYKEYNV